MNARVIVWFVGIALGVYLVYQAYRLEDELKQRKKEWIIPITIVGVMSLLCLSFFVFTKTIEDLYHRYPSIFAGLLVLIAAFTVSRFISTFLRLGGFRSTKNASKADDNQEERLN